MKLKLHAQFRCMKKFYNRGALSDPQGLHRLEKYLNLESFLEKSLKNKSALKITGKSLKGLEKSFNFTIYRRFQQCF